MYTTVKTVTNVEQRREAKKKNVNDEKICRRFGIYGVWDGIVY